MKNLINTLFRLKIICISSYNNNPRNYFYKVNNLEQLQKDLDFKINMEPDYLEIHFKGKTSMIPITETGVNLIYTTFQAINDIKSNWFMHGISEKNNTNFIYYIEIIQNTYSKLEIEQYRNILIFNELQEFKFDTELNISLLSLLEPLIRVLNYNFPQSDIKKLNFDIIPIIFPIKYQIDFFYYTDNNLTSSMVELVKNNFFKIEGSDFNAKP